MAINISRRDPDRRRTLVCLMDGEQKSWDLPGEWRGRSVEILDFFHALQSLRAVSKIVQSKDKKDTRHDEWVSGQVRDLLTANVETVIRRSCRLEREE